MKSQAETIIVFVCRGWGSPGLSDLCVAQLFGSVPELGDHHSPLASSPQHPIQNCHGSRRQDSERGRGSSFSEGEPLSLSG